MTYKFRGCILHPPHPNIDMHVLRTIFHTFSKVLTGIIDLRLRAYLVGDHICYSRDFHLWFRVDIVSRN